MTARLPVPDFGAAKVVGQEYVAESYRHIPVIATSSVYADYLSAARKNLDAMLRLSQALKDREFEHEAQFLLDCFDDAVIGADEIIATANERASVSDPYPSFGMHHPDDPRFGGL